MPTVQKTNTPVTPTPDYSYASLKAPEPTQSTTGRYISHVCKIKPSSVILYKRYTGFSTGKTEAELKNLEIGKSGEYNGYMSPATTRKVRTVLENWLKALERDITNDWQTEPKKAFADPKAHEYYPTFITLTLPGGKQLHDDNYVKREMLNRFIINLKSRYKVEHYFWRAEPQRNGSIHFHILTDRWIFWKSVRYDWNRICDEHGYIDEHRRAQQHRHKNGYREDTAQVHGRVDHAQKHALAAGQKFDVKSEIKRAKISARKAYDEGIKNNWSDPNSTDIHAIERVENITAYVVKYVTKKADNKEVTVRDSDGNEIKGTHDRKLLGRIWGCSDGIRDLKHFEDDIATEMDFHTLTHDNDAFDFVRHLEKDAIARQEANPDDETVWSDPDSGTVVYKLDKQSYIILRELFPQLFNQYAHHYENIYATLYNKPAPILKTLDTVRYIPDLRDSFTMADKQTAIVDHASNSFPALHDSANLHPFGTYRADCPF